MGKVRRAIFSPLSKLDNLAGYVPWTVALASPKLLIGKIVLIVLGFIGDFVIAMEATDNVIKEKDEIIVPPLDPTGENLARQDMAQKRKTDFRGRRLRESIRIKIDYMKNHGFSQKAIDKVLNKARRGGNNDSGKPSTE